MSDKFGESTEGALATVVDVFKIHENLAETIRSLMGMAFIEGKGQGAIEFRAALEKEFPPNDSP